MKLGLILLVLLVSNFSGAGTGNLFSQMPKAYPTYINWNAKKQVCFDLIAPNRAHFMKLRNQGEKVALILNKGNKILNIKRRLKDELNGVRYPDINSYIEALEDHVAAAMPHAKSQKIQNEVRKCTKGLKSKYIKEGCTRPVTSNYLHAGFVVLDKNIPNTPFIVHYYGDAEYKYMKGAIRVESLDSYLNEKAIPTCQTRIVHIKKKAQRRIIDFLNKDFGSKVLAAGNKNYNLVAHPWGLKTQNCNIWTSEVLAASLFANRSEWSKMNRREAKNILFRTGFIPMKTGMSNIQALLRIPSPFVNGLSAEEGNFIHHPYAVADIVPPISILEWLDGHGVLTNAKTIKGRKTN